MSGPTNSEVTGMTKEALIEKRNKVIEEMNKTCPSWQPKRLRALQVEASRLASEIGRRMD